MEIVVNHVTKTIKNITVIEDVSLTLTSGTIYGLRGVNGSGKTTVSYTHLTLPTNSRV